MSATTNNKPDFAFPQKVIQNAEKQLELALSTGNGEQTIDALIRYGVAQTSISPDSIGVVAERVAQIEKMEKEPVTKSLLDLLLARIYLTYYEENAWNLNNRTTMAGEGDMTLWSGEQFRDTIVSLVDSALANPGSLQEAKLTDYEQIIIANKVTRRFYQTVYDFACSQSIALLTSVGENDNSVAEPVEEVEESTANGLNISGRIRKIATEWALANAGKDGPYVEARLAQFMTKSLEGPIMSIDIEDEIAESKYTEILMDLYESNRKNEYAVRFLTAINVRELDLEQKTRLYGLLEEFRKNHPKYFNINDVTNLINELTQKRMSIEYPGQVSPGSEFDITVNVSNISQPFNLYIQRVSKRRALEKKDFVGNPVSVIKVDPKCSIPGVNSVTVKGKIESYGFYVIYTDAIPMNGYQSFNVLSCSDLVLVDGVLSDDMTAWVVNAVSGEPVEGADVKCTVGYEPYTSVKNYTSDASGMVEINGSDKHITLEVSKGGDCYAGNLGLWMSRNNRQQKSRGVYIQTDLAVYHPGDKCGFVGFAYEYEQNSRTPIAGRKIMATLSDANGQPVDTIACESDDYGRLSSEFKLPDTGLTGNFCIRLYDNEVNYQNFLGVHYLLVSDYKLPTYEVTIDSIRMSEVGKKSVCVSGKALTYSGFPVQNAEVKVRLEAMENWWWRSESRSFGSVENCRTDSEGRFDIVIDQATLSKSPYPKGIVQVGLTVTSAAGENRFGSATFSLRKGHTIMLNIDNYLTVSDKTPIQAGVVNMLGDAVPADMVLKFTGKEGTVEIEARSENGTVKANLSQLRSGIYKLEASAPKFDAEAQTINNVIVYNSKDNVCPVEDTPLWLPTERMVVDGGKPIAEFVIATPYEMQRALMIVNTPEKVISREWITLHKGLNSQRVTLPADADNATISIVGVRDMNCTIRRVNVTIKHPSREVKVEIESLRDHLTPLSTERVTVKVTDGNNRGVASALVLDMYSKALDAIKTESWHFTPERGYIGSIKVDTSLSSSLTQYYTHDIKWLKEIDIVPPEYNLYGYGFSSTRYRVRAYGSAPKLMMSACTDDMDMEVCEESVAVNDCVLASPPLGDTGSYRAKEAREDKKAAEMSEEENYRPSEVPLAFFAPDLTVGEDGVLTYTFEVPNANTTWVLNALVVNKLINTALATEEVISSKPVMVEPNMPRFIRQGDEALVRASVMNATEEEAEIKTVFEVLNPADMRVLSRQETIDVVAGKSSTIATFSLDGNTHLSAYIVRVKSTSGNYTDGVQTLMPVLAATQQVIDSEVFYLRPDEKKFSMAMPVSKGEAMTTLSFCENPTWEVVSALPGLRASSDGTSLGASAEIFSAAVAQRVLELNPEVKEHLQGWLDGNADDQSLLSMLNRNEDLKQLVLTSTPWVAEAQSDVERIARLGLLFKPGEISQAISSGTETLSKLQGQDGGWRWFATSEKSSEWVTLMILNNFAELRQLNCFPKELNEMTTKACRYIDNAVSDAYKKYHVKTDFYYTYVRSLYPEDKIKGDAKTVFDNTVKEMRDNWRRAGVCKKAAIALVLYRTGDQATAKTILASIREFATSTPESGMWWDSIEGSTWWSLMANGQTAFILDAFNTIEPGCAEIDPIRQWLILNKTVQDWGTSVNSSAIVSTILNCGTNWLYKPGQVTIKVGGKKIEPGEVDRLTGSFAIGVENPKGNLTIDRKGTGPAWGAVINRSTQAMTEIAARSIPELSVRKQMLVNVDGKWVESDRMTVGQVARIRLIVSAQRDMDYVSIVDERAATFEPVEQRPHNIYCDGLYFYMENRNDRTNIFIDRLPKGQYILEYEMNVNNAGRYSSGIATIQSQYAPEMTAHSAGTELLVE